MANITPIVPAIAGAVAAFVPSTPAGDAIAYSSGDLLIEFDNGHSASITIGIAPTQTSAFVPGAGPVTIPSRSLVLATTEGGAFLLRRNEISAYLDANGRIPLTYTGGNAALLLRAFAIE